MKASIFLVFSVLIHCYIFRFALLGNSQEGLLTRLFLRTVKNSSAPTAKQKTLNANKTETSHFREPSFFAPKKLKASEVSKLGYRDGLVYLIQSKAIYPIIAQDLEQSGSVIVAVDLDKDGIVIGSKIKSESEYELLNQAALKAVRSMDPYKPLPRKLHPYATFLVPIHFF